MYLLTNNTRKLFICFVSIAFLCAFNGLKDTSYYIENKDEALSFIENECKDENETNNEQCKAAIEAIKKIEEASQRESLIQEAFEPPKEEVAEEEPKTEILSEDHYTKIFTKFPDKINQVMEERCEELLSDPEYYKTPEKQDNECNAAAKQQELLKKEKAKSIGDNKKNLLYYKSNMTEAKAHAEDCIITKESSLSCQYAIIAVKEDNKEKETKASLTEYFNRNIIAAKDTVTKCQEEKEKDQVRCEVAFKVYNKNIKKNRNKNIYKNHLNHFKQNPDEAKKLFNTKCKSFTRSKHKTIFIQNDECMAVKEVMKEARQKNEKNELLKILNTYKDKFTLNISETNSFSLRKYRSLHEHFSNDLNLTESFIASCIESKTRARVSSLDCLAAVNVIVEKLESAQKIEEEKEKAKKEFKNYYKKYFSENPDRAKKLLEGRCKIVFSNQWHDYDTNLKDEECEAARFEQKRLKRLQKQQELEKLNAKKKTEEYYIKNIDFTKETDKNCRKGIIKDLHDCEMSIKTLELIDDNKKQTEKYKLFYRNHILAAKYKLKWCKSNMVKFDTHCYVVLDIIKNHVEKTPDDEKYKEKSDFFNQNPFEAIILLHGKCKELIEDKWYFLDKNMQTEECNAAFDVIRGYD